MKEQHERQDFEARKSLVRQINENSLVKYGGVTLRNVYPDNSYFPHFLYGVDIQAGKKGVIKLEDNNLPAILNDNRDFEVQIPDIEPLETELAPSRSGSPQESRSGSLAPAYQEVAEAIGDPLFGILTKLSTDEGMSSQLIKRFDAKARGEIHDLLPGERQYEEVRNRLRVFYVTRHFCEITDGFREKALSDMLELENTRDEKERQEIALKNPVFGLKSPKKEL